MPHGILDVDAVGFDFDHTLGVDHQLERTVAVELAGEERARAIDVALGAYRYGARSIDDAMAGAGIDPERFRALVLERAAAFVEPLPGAARVLAALRERGIPVAILSNGWSPLQEHKARLVGFDGPVLVSDAIGVRKPAYAAFLRLERALGVPSARIAYVGDDPVPDMCGALSAGMRAVWLDAEQRTYPQDIAEPSARIAALLEILTLVQGHAQETAKPPA